MLNIIFSCQLFKNIKFLPQSTLFTSARVISPINIDNKKWIGIVWDREDVKTKKLNTQEYLPNWPRYLHKDY